MNGVHSVFLTSPYLPKWLFSAPELDHREKNDKAKTHFKMEVEETVSLQQSTTNPHLCPSLLGLTLPGGTQSPPLIRQASARHDQMSDQEQAKGPLHFLKWFSGQPGESQEPCLSQKGPGSSGSARDHGCCWTWTMCLDEVMLSQNSNLFQRTLPVPEKFWADGNG